MIPRVSSSARRQLLLAVEVVYVGVYPTNESTAPSSRMERWKLPLPLLRRQAAVISLLFQRNDKNHANQVPVGQRVATRPHGLCDIRHVLFY
jgi:hypothetical protein